MRPDLLLARLDLIEASRPSVDYCRRYGIEWSAVEAHAGGVFLVEAQQVGRFFDPAPDGELMAWVDAFASDAETLIDCVAWPIERPGTVLTLGGVAVALGEAVAVNAATYSFGAALHLHRTPLAWLQSKCDGAVILDPSAGARWLLDLPAPRIAAEDDAHAREIMRARQALTERQIIVVPQGRRRPDREAA